ncbi:hypothetical protein BFL40_31640 [Pseudomonas costantinii]|uniref:Uncharacterized protein n=1 Tax=Pseudomonas costantinii TaxID=168469 RepID=A0A1S2U9X3_9PSED|nr:hypothetical protein BFL40_31640 [Pseudomonas costantinii]
MRLARLDALNAASLLHYLAGSLDMYDLYVQSACPFKQLLVEQRAWNLEALPGNIATLVVRIETRQAVPVHPMAWVAWVIQAGDL